jgi:hypothetical protein
MTHLGPLCLEETGPGVTRFSFDVATDSLEVEVFLSIGAASEEGAAKLAISSNDLISSFDELQDQKDHFQTIGVRRGVSKRVKDSRRLPALRAGHC